VPGDTDAQARLLADLGARLVGLDDVVAPVVVACSGGPDSLALLALAEAADLAPVAVHVDHRLRSGSEAEADVVAAHAARLGVPFRAERVDVEPGANVEARARAARYEALDRARGAVAATVVLVGHTADDQAETVLLNLLRGSATTGLGGMPVARDALVRPMLDLRRAETERLCTELGFEPVRDPSNDDRTLRRNWIRHEVLPLLSQGSGRDLVPVLARQARLLRDDAEYLDALAAAVVADADGPSARVLATMPEPLARRAVRLWLGPPPPSLDEVERVLAVARGEARATQLTGPRRVQRADGRLVVLERQ
jgi:tRNA(Ile)-lysidine synthase